MPPSVQKIGHMLLAGHTVEDAARLEGVPEDVIQASLRDIASRPEAEPPLVSLLSLVAEGRSPREARKQLDLSNEDFKRILKQLLGGPGTPQPSQFFPAGTPGGPQRVVPVRFPEPQYDRLKEWCATHGFPMAAVVRGLVERFLDEQDRRAA